MTMTMNLTYRWLDHLQRPRAGKYYVINVELTVKPIGLGKSGEISMQAQ